MAFLGIGKKEKLTPEQIRARQAEIARNVSYLGLNPAVNKAYESDPRTGIANALTKTGSDTSPLAGGMTEGLARVASGLAGGYIGGQQRERYDAYDDSISRSTNAAERPRLAEAVNAQQAPVIDPTVAALGVDNSALAQVASAPTFEVAQALGPQGAQPAPALAPNPTIQGQPDTVGPQQTSTTQSPQSTPTLASVAQRSSGANLPQNYSMPVRGGRVEARAAGVPRTERANTGFNSYKSSAYDPIEEKYAAEYGIPVELLRGIRLNGEKSNANQVSSANARTVYQFTKDTRDLWIKNKGYDPWASPENAVKAAAEHLADDYKATGGNVKETVARYIAGPSGKNRGPVTRAYVDRVTSGLGGDIPGGSQASQPSAGSAAQVPQAPQIDMPEIPQEPDRPTRPDLPERVRSARLGVAYNLLEQNPDMDPTLLRAAMQPYLEKGYDEDAQFKQDEYKERANLIGDEFRSDRSLYNDVTGAIRKQPIEERNAAIEQRNALQRDQYGAEVARETREDTQQYGTSERVAGQVYGEASDQANRMENRYLMERKALLDREEARRAAAQEGGKVETAAQITDYNGHQDAAVAGQNMYEIGNRVETILEGMDTGGLTRAGLAGDARARYDAGVAELKALQKELSLAKLNGKLGAGISNSDVAFVLDMTKIGPDTPEPLLRKAAKGYQLLGQRQRDYNDNYLDAKYGDNADLATFTRRWTQYRNEVPLRDEKGNLNPAAVGYDYKTWLAEALKNGWAR